MDSNIELNKIYHGDCLEIMKQIPDKSVDLLLTDPPYEFINKNPTGGGFMHKENKKHLKEIDSSFGMSFNPAEFLELVIPKMKKFNAYIFTNKTLLKDYIEFAEQRGYKRDILLWLKDNPVPIFKGHHLIDKEYIMYIKESGALFNSDLGYDSYFTYMTSPIGNKEFDHPTVKPLHIIKRLMATSSARGGVVLDPFLGSGTTAVACKELGRNYIGIEKEEGYINIATQRLANTTISLF